MHAHNLIYLHYSTELHKNTIINPKPPYKRPLPRHLQTWWIGSQFRGHAPWPHIYTHHLKTWNLTIRRAESPNRSRRRSARTVAHAPEVRCRHIPSIHLQNMDRCINLVRPNVDATTSSDRATTLRVSIITCAPPRSRCAMPPRQADYDSVEITRSNSGPLESTLAPKMMPLTGSMKLGAAIIR
jgi:hypothetical protein